MKTLSFKDLISCPMGTSRVALIPTQPAYTESKSRFDITQKMNVSSEGRVSFVGDITYENNSDEIGLSIKYSCTN